MTEKIEEYANMEDIKLILAELLAKNKEHSDSVNLNDGVRSITLTSTRAKLPTLIKTAISVLKNDLQPNGSTKNKPEYLK